VIEPLVRFKLFFLLIIFYSNLFSQTYPNNAVDSLWKEFNQLLVLQDYTTAAKKAKEISTEFPQNPLGPMLSAAVEITCSYDLGIEYQLETIDSLLDKSFSYSESILDTNDDDIWGNYFAGASLGYKAYYSAINGNFMQAFMDGYSALQYFDKCLQLDASFHEAKILIGNYLYWKSAKTSELSWLPFFNDERNNGIDLIKEAIDSANYNSFVASYTLMWILVNENSIDEANELAENSFQHYTNNRLFKYALAKSLKENNPDKTIKFYEEILNSYMSIESNNHFKEITFLHKLAQLYFSREDYKITINYIDRMFNLVSNLNPVVKAKLEDRFDRAKILRDKALRLSSNN
jgi:hypothetical protein